MKKQIFFLTTIFALFMGVEARAESFQLKSRQCKAVKRTADGKWETASLGAIPEKTILRGQRAKTQKVFLFKWDQKVYAVSTNCITSLDKAAPSEDLEDRGSPWKVYPFVSILSWHERVTITSSDGRASQLYSSNFGACPGLGATRKISSGFAWDSSICLIYARSDLANSSSASSTANTVFYTTKNSRSYGLKGEIDALWTLSKEHTSIGLGVPLMYRMGAWPKPTSASYKITPDPAFHYGVHVLSDLEFDHLRFKPKFGYLLSGKGLIWSLDIAYLF